MPLYYSWNVYEPGPTSLVEKVGRAMNCPHCDVSSLSADGLERIASCGQCQGDWTAIQSGRVVYRDNLIYLPFASHLSETDARDEEAKKAA